MESQHINVTNALSASQYLLAWMKNPIRYCWHQLGIYFDWHSRGADNDFNRPSNHASSLGRPYGRDTGQSGHVDELDGIPLQYYKNLMLANGWCHHQVQRLSSSSLCSHRTFSYLASRQRSIRLSDHTRCLDHLMCAAYNTDSATYQTQHVDQRCECPSVRAPNEALLKIIRRGGVPLVSIQDSPNGDTETTIQVSARNIWSSYIAVSHIWADGLGNVAGNGLPLCQIKKLKMAVTALHKTFKSYRNDPMVRCYYL